MLSIFVISFFVVLISLVLLVFIKKQLMPLILYIFKPFKTYLCVLNCYLKLVIVPKHAYKVTSLNSLYVL